MHTKADLTRYLDPGCNIVDIGANTGDAPLVLAVAAKGGTVVAFEMGCSGLIRGLLSVELSI